MTVPVSTIDLRDPVDLIPEKLHPDRGLRRLRRKDLQHISPHPESAAVEIHVISVILDIDELLNHLITVFLHARPERDHHLFIVHRAAQTVNAGHAGDNDHVFPLHQCHSGGEPQLIDLIVGRGILGNIGIRGRHIGLRLVIIVVGDKVFHGIFRKKLFKFPVKLGRQRLIVGDDQRRAYSAAAITFAIVKVLPDPVTPRSVSA